MSLTRLDYQNIVRFIDYSLSDHKNIQLLLSQLFQLNRSLFWHADEHGNMHSLNFYNYSEQLVIDYREIHKINDVMHPKKHLLKLGSSKNSVYTIGEVTTPKQLLNSSYYEFIKYHEIIDQMVIYLSTPSTIHAGIGFVRFKHEKPFSKKDKMILQTLSVHLQHLVKNSTIMKEATTISSLLDTNIECSAKLSNRELEVYQLVIRGYSNIEIAAQLYVSINTVKKHLVNMYEKNQVNSRTSLIYKLDRVEQSNNIVC